MSLHFVTTDFTDDTDYQNILMSRNFNVYVKVPKVN